ncbi:microtubule-associated futsch, partial [Brachionus plicatilis]
MSNEQYAISFSNESTFEFSLLINTSQSQFKTSFKQLLQSEHKQKFLLNLTFDYNQNGDLNLSDSLLTCDDIHSYLSLYHTSGTTLDLIMNQKMLDSNKNWRHLDKQAQVSVKPIQSVVASQPCHQFDDFVQLLEPYLNQRPVDQLMDAPICTGTLKIQRPSLYIFPAGQGDSCYFAINGFTMLINGGHHRLKPCFWKFVNMLEQIDAVLVTHTDSDSLGGLTSLFQKKASSVDVKPRVSVLLANLIGSHSSPAMHSSPNKAANLIVNELPNCAGNKSDSDLILEAIDRLQIKLQPLVIQRPLAEKVKLNYDHFKLYYKAYYGSLDLYLLSPNVQSTEFRDFCAQQQTMLSKMHKSHLAVNQVHRNLAASHLASSVCLLVWQPSYKADSANTALRLLFTGNCPQHVLFNALDKLKDFDLLHHPVHKIKSDLDQNQQYYNAIRKEHKVVKEPANPSKLNTSMSKSNGADVKKTAARPPKAAAPVPPKKTDTSINKPLADKKPVAVSSRQSLNSAKATKASVESKPAAAAKQPAGKQSAKPAVPRPVKSEPARKTSSAKLPPVKKDAKSSKTLSLSIEPAQCEPEQSGPACEPAVLQCELKESVVVEQNYVNNVVVVESDNVEQIEQVEQVEVVEQVIEQQVVEHEQEVVEREVSEVDRMHDQEVVEMIEEKSADVEQVVEESNQSRNLVVDEEEFEQQEHQLQAQETHVVQMEEERLGEREDGVLVGEVKGHVVEEQEAAPLVLKEEQRLGEQEDVVSVGDVRGEVMEEQEAAPLVLKEEQRLGEQEDVVSVGDVRGEVMEEQEMVPMVQSEHGEEPMANAEDGNQVEKAYSNESPNLSPVKKDFCEQNGLGEHLNAPVSEDQISSVENGNLDENTDEIVSGNIEKREHGCNDDIMTRSFIEDASDPNSNPFNPVKPLNESCDLNRTHELFQDEESSNTSKTEDLVNLVETIKIDQNHEVNLLELPSPVNPENVGISSKRSAQPGSPSQNSDAKSLKNTSASSALKSARSAPIHPVYVELAYIPAHGNPSYVDADFFKRVRARHYVLSAVDFGEPILNALLDGKETWEDKNLQVTLVPTYESDVLRRWFENNQERLARLKVEITPAARHSIVTIDENPDLNCQAYK